MSFFKKILFACVLSPLSGFSAEKTLPMTDTKDSYCLNPLHPYAAMKQISFVLFQDEKKYGPFSPFQQEAWWINIFHNINTLAKQCLNDKDTLEQIKNILSNIKQEEILSEINGSTLAVHEKEYLQEAFQNKENALQLIQIFNNIFNDMQVFSELFEEKYDQKTGSLGILPHPLSVGNVLTNTPDPADHAVNTLNEIGKRLQEEEDFKTWFLKSADSIPEAMMKVYDILGIYTKNQMQSKPLSLKTSMQKVKDWAETFSKS